MQLVLVDVAGQNHGVYWPIQLEAQRLLGDLLLEAGVVGHEVQASILGTQQHVDEGALVNIGSVAVRHRQVDGVLQVGAVGKGAACQLGRQDVQVVTLGSVRQRRLPVMTERVIGFIVERDERGLSQLAAVVLQKLSLLALNHQLERRQEWIKQLQHAAKAGTLQQALDFLPVSQAHVPLGPLNGLGGGVVDQPRVQRGQTVHQPPDALVLLQLGQHLAAGSGHGLLQHSEVAGADSLLKLGQTILAVLVEQELEGLGANLRYAAVAIRGVSHQRLVQAHHRQGKTLEVSWCAIFE